MLDDYKAAIIWAEKALSIDSKHVNSLHSIGESLRMLGNFANALQILDQVLNIYPSSELSLASKGACLNQHLFIFSLYKNFFKIQGSSYLLYQSY